MFIKNSQFSLFPLSFLSNIMHIIGEVIHSPTYLYAYFTCLLLDKLRMEISVAQRTSRMITQCARANGWVLRTHTLPHSLVLFIFTLFSFLYMAEGTTHQSHIGRAHAACFLLHIFLLYTKPSVASQGYLLT